MADDILVNLQAALNHKKREQHLSTLAKQGDDEFVQAFLTDNITVQSTGPFALKSQLYVASFWGIKDIVQQLLEIGTNPSLQNDETLWTPLHAATFQEHGPVVMLLLEHGAQPELPDEENRTPADFASASDKIWPFFAALDIDRTPRIELIKKRILRPASGMQRSREPGHGIEMAEYKPSSGLRREEDNDNNFMAARSGDVLADDDEAAYHSQRNRSHQPQFSLWK